MPKYFLRPASPSCHVRVDCGHRRARQRRELRTYPRFLRNALGTGFPAPRSQPADGPTAVDM